MKDSGIEWIGNIPIGWEVKKLKFISEIKTGDKDTVNSEEYGQYPFFVRSQTVEKISSYTYDGEAILTAGDGDIGKIVHYVNGKFDFHQRVYCIKKIKINGKFLYYFFQENFIKEAKRNNAKSTVDSIRMPVLRNFPVLNPPNLIQAAIADYLDTKCGIIESLIEKQKTVIEKLKSYKQSLITEAVTKGLDPTVKMKSSGIEWIGDIPEGWEVRRLKNIGEAIIGLTYSPTEVSDNGTLVLRSSNIQNGKIVLDDNVYVKKKIQDKLIIKIEDILICSRNGSKELVGKCAYIDNTLRNEYSFGAFMTVFRSMYNNFLYHVLNSAIFSFHLNTFSTSTINQLTTRNLNGIQVPLPPLSEQKRIVDFLNTKCTETANAINGKQKLIERLTDYKKSLIYECVTGKKEVLINE